MSGSLHERETGGRRTRRNRAVALALIVLLLFRTVGAAAQTTDDKTPEPYTEEEFPQWARDLRRAEIIAIGSFPFTLFFTNFAYDTYRFVANGFDPAYRPWPFRGPGSAGFTKGERIGVIVASLSLSAVIAVVDYFLGRAEAEREAARRPEPVTAPVVPFAGPAEVPDTPSTVIDEEPGSENPESDRDGAAAP
jgi:hypothetical protein